MWLVCIPELWWQAKQLSTKTSSWTRSIPSSSKIVFHLWSVPANVPVRHRSGTTQVGPWGRENEAAVNIKLWSGVANEQCLPASGTTEGIFISVFIFISIFIFTRRHLYLYLHLLSSPEASSSLSGASKMKTLMMSWHRLEETWSQTLQQHFWDSNKHSWDPRKRQPIQATFREKLCGFYGANPEPPHWLIPIQTKDTASIFGLGG